MFDEIPSHIDPKAETVLRAWDGAAVVPLMDNRTYGFSEPVNLLDRVPYHPSDK